MIAVDVYNTPIHITTIDFDPSIVNQIYHLTTQHSSEKRSNRGGIQLPRMNENSLPWMSPIINSVQQAASKPGHLTYWFNINGPGHYNKLHGHGPFGDHLCGCMYIQAPENSGDIQFQELNGTRTVNVTPYAGMLVLFPNNLKHAVLKNNSNHDRISIAFNFWKMLR